MRTQLPTATAAPTSVDRAFWSTEPRRWRSRRMRLAALAMVIVLAAAYWLVSGGRAPPTKLRVNGRLV